MFLNAQESKSIYFDFSKEHPNEASSIELNQWIESNKNAEIIKIEGFCDSVGTNLYNKKLAEKRIKSIEKILKSNKISFSQQMLKDVYGEDFEGSTKQDENRRVTIFYKEKVETKSYAVDLSSAEVGQYLALKGLNFYGGKDKVLPQSTPVLEELLEVMKNNEKLKIQIHGHICCFTADTENLSFKRAQAVYDYLVVNGISRDRISFKGFGSTKPIHPLSEKSEEERIANRRVEIFVLEK